jgi:hypothetical protein
VVGQEEAEFKLVVEAARMHGVSHLWAGRHPTVMRLSHTEMRAELQGLVHLETGKRFWSEVQCKQVLQCTGWSRRLVLQGDQVLFP